jgi:hypothetical protein
MSLGIMTLGIMTLAIMALIVINSIVMLSVNDLSINIGINQLTFQLTGGSMGSGYVSQLLCCEKSQNC